MTTFFLNRLATEPHALAFAGDAPAGFVRFFESLGNPSKQTQGASE